MTEMSDLSYLRKPEKNLHTNQQNEHTPGFIIVAVLFFDKCNRIF